MVLCMVDAMLWYCVMCMVDVVVLCMVNDAVSYFVMKFVCFSQTAFRCDFLNVDITDCLPTQAAIESYISTLHSTIDRHNKQLEEFPAKLFHVVVFCLLLEYLPTSELRVRCCQKAWQLLAVDGLLLIITPDSRGQHRNHRVATVWTRTIESIGFDRWRYEKLQHLHCMAFRKVGGGDTPCEPTDPCTALLIPQDVNCTVPETAVPGDSVTDDIDLEQSSNNFELLCSELPFNIEL